MGWIAEQSVGRPPVGQGDLCPLSWAFVVRIIMPGSRHILLDRESVSAALAQAAVKTDELVKTLPGFANK